MHLRKCNRGPSLVQEPHCGVKARNWGEAPRSVLNKIQVGRSLQTVQEEAVMPSETSYN